MRDRQHITGFDFIRPIAAFSVVWIHGCAGSFWTKKLNPLNSYAVPVFIAISMFLFAWQVIGKGRDDFKEMLVTRFKRLMIPFFLWTLIYLGIRLFKAKFVHEPFEIAWIEMFVFKGSSYQLWYLPNLFYLSILFFFLLKFRQALNIMIPLIILISAAVLWNTPADIRQADWFTRHILLYFVPSLISASIGIMYYINYDEIRANYGTSLKVLVPIWAVILFFAQLYVPHVLIGLAFVAVLIPLLLFQVSMRASYPGMMALSRNSMGIYLVHGVFLEGIKTGMQLVHHPIRGLAMTLGSIIITYLLSFVVSEWLSKNDTLKKYLMGN
jgi:peptidoglycan/LPS O-acetylase OafA/YrhL